MTREINKAKIHLRILTLYTNRPFRYPGSDLRRAITAQFKDNPVLHNHTERGFDYKSPQVRYIAIKGVPRLLSFDKGLDIVEKIYKEQPTLKVGTASYKVIGTELEDRIEDIGIVGGTTYRYSSITPWIALNEENYSLFVRAGVFEARKKILSKILVGNLLSLSKNLNVEIKETINVELNNFSEIELKAGHLPLLGLNANFETNYKLPELVGIGKLVSKGFGIMHMISSQSTSPSPITGGSESRYRGASGR